MTTACERTSLRRTADHLSGGRIEQGMRVVKWGAILTSFDARRLENSNLHLHGYLRNRSSRRLRMLRRPAVPAGNDDILS